MLCILALLCIRSFCIGTKSSGDWKVKRRSNNRFKSACYSIRDIFPSHRLATALEIRLVSFFRLCLEKFLFPLKNGLKRPKMVSNAVFLPIPGLGRDSAAYSFRQSQA